MAKAEHHKRNGGGFRVADIPEGWTYVALEEVTIPVPNCKPEDEPHRQFRYIDIASISNTTQQITDCKNFLGAQAPSRARRPVKPGDVLFSNVRTYLRNIALVTDELGADLCSSGFTVLRPNGSIDSRFLFYSVLADSFIDTVTELQTGTHYPAVSDRAVLAQEIPLAPLPEQRRVVAKIDAMLARVGAARQRLANIPLILKRFRQSVLAAACSGRFTEARRSAGAEWSEVSLRDLVERLDQGWSPKCEIEPSRSPEVWGIIKTTAVQPLWFDESENKKLPGELGPRPELEVRAGDLLVTRAGPRARAGVTCLVRAVRPRLMICDKVYRFRVRPLVASAEFVNLVLNEPLALEGINSMKTGISDSGVNLTQDKFLDLQVRLPALDEQREIVRRVEALFKLANAIEKRVAMATARAEKLTLSILAKAFRGELVPTEAELARREGRDYEPAAELLARIRASAAQHGTIKRERRRRASAAVLS